MSMYTTSCRHPRQSGFQHITKSLLNCPSDHLSAKEIDERIANSTRDTTLHSPEILLYELTPEELAFQQYLLRLYANDPHPDDAGPPLVSAPAGPFTINHHVDMQQYNAFDMEIDDGYGASGEESGDDETEGKGKGKGKGKASIFPGPSGFEYGVQPVGQPVI